LKPSGTEFYLANVGKFNVESYFGLSQLYEIGKQKLSVPDLSHTQVQSLIGAIGIKKGFDLWYPDSDKLKIDNKIVDYSKIRKNLPTFNFEIDNIISEIDVIWMQNSKPVSFFEVEHSTDIYRSLLKFCELQDFYTKYFVVADTVRKRDYEEKVSATAFSPIQNRIKFMSYDQLSEWHERSFQVVNVERGIGL